MLAILSLIPGVGPVLAFLKLNPLIAKALGALAVLLLVVAIVVGFAAHERGVQKARDEARAAAAVSAARALAAKAGDHATVSRTNDNAAVAALQKDFSDAIAKAPGGQLSPADLALNCRRLRGTPAARLPEFAARCGPDASPQAGRHD